MSIFTVLWIAIGATSLSAFVEQKRKGKFQVSIIE